MNGRGLIIPVVSSPRGLGVPLRAAASPPRPSFWGRSGRGPPRPPPVHLRAREEIAAEPSGHRSPRPLVSASPLSPRLAAPAFHSERGLRPRNLSGGGSV